MSRYYLYVFALAAPLALGACTTDLISQEGSAGGYKAFEAVKAGDAILNRPGPADNATAARYYKKAAVLGGSWGQYKYANMLLDGKGVPQNKAAAADYYAKAAEQDNAWAQLRLGEMYSDGNGVTKDSARALELLTKSAAQKNAWAQFRLGEIYLDGTGTPKNVDRGVKNLTLSADHGHNCGLANFMLMERASKRMSPAARNILSSRQNKATHSRRWLWQT